VYRKNRIGPRTDPCGTPYRTADGVEHARVSDFCTVYRAQRYAQRGVGSVVC